MKSRLCSLAVRLAVLIVILTFWTEPALANNTKKFCAEFQVQLDRDPAGNLQGLQFTIDKGSLKDGLQPGDVSVSILAGSNFQSSLRTEEPNQTLRKTRLPNGDLLVTIAADIRTPRKGQVAKVKVCIEKENVKSLRITRPKWGDIAKGEFEAEGDAKITGGAFKLDPQYVAYNDVEATALQIRNLEFQDNLTESQFDALDLDALYNASFNPSLPQFLLLPGQNSEDLGLTFFAGPEPEPDRFIVATGQVYDPVSGQVVSAFVQGVCAAPEPGVAAMLVASLAAGLVFARRHRQS